MSITEQSESHSAAGVDRRTFIGYVVGGTTLVAAAELGSRGTAPRRRPDVPQIPELYDLERPPDRRRAADRH